MEQCSHKCLCEPVKAKQSPAYFEIATSDVILLAMTANEI